MQLQMHRKRKDTAETWKYVEWLGCVNEDKLMGFVLEKLKGFVLI